SLYAREGTISVLYLLVTCAAFGLGAIFATDFPIAGVGIAWIVLSYALLVFGYNIDALSERVRERKSIVLDFRTMEIATVACLILGLVYVAILAGSVVETLSTLDVREAQIMVSDSIIDHYKQYEEGSNLDRSWYHGLVAFLFAGSMLTGLLCGGYGLRYRRNLWLLAAMSALALLVSFSTGTRTSIVYCFLYFITGFLTGV